MLNPLKTLQRALAFVRSALDLPDIVVILALLLLGYGASQFHQGAGPVLVGALLFLYVRPLSRLVK